MVIVYPGSFDIATTGHLDIITRASKIASKLIVAVLNNTSKRTMFDTKERVAMLKLACEGMDNVEIMAFDGLLVDFVERVGACVVVRGLRSMSDFEGEFKMAMANKALKDSVETIFMPTSPEYAFISSSMVKEVAELGGDVGKMVPESIVKIIEKKILQKNAYL